MRAAAADLPGQSLKLRYIHVGVRLDVEDQCKSEPAQQGEGVG